MRRSGTWPPVLRRGDACVALFRIHRRAVNRHDELLEPIGARSLWILRIQRPPLRIIEDVLTNLVQRILVADDVLEVIGLPQIAGSTGAQLIYLPRDSGFERSDDSAEGL